MAIKVEIGNGQLNSIKHDVLIGQKIIKGLKQAGIPVKADAFVLRGIERGSLTYESGEFSHHFIWREDHNDRDTNWVLGSATGVGVSSYNSGRHVEGYGEDDDEL